MAGIVLLVGGNTIIVAPRREIVYQIGKRFKELGINNEVLLDKSVEGWREKVVITTYHYLGGKLSNLAKTAKLLCIDEQHSSASRTRYKAVMKCNAPYRFGFTATPQGRSDNADSKIIALTGPIIASMKPAELIESNWLADAKICIIDLEIPSYKAWDWQETYIKGIVNNKLRNKVIVDIALHESRKGNKTMIICNYIEHTDIIYKMLQERGAKAILFKSELSKKDRVEALEKFKAAKGGEYIFVSSPIGSEGIDIPDLACFILASGYKSPIQTLQRIGRAMRPGTTDEVKSAKIYDFYDRQKSEAALTKHSKQRLKVYIENFGMDRVSMIPYKEIAEEVTQ